MLPINMRARGPRGPHSWAVSTPEYHFQWGDEKYQAFCSWSQETTQPRLQATAGGGGGWGICSCSGLWRKDPSSRLIHCELSPHSGAEPRIHQGTLLTANTINKTAAWGSISASYSTSRLNQLKTEASKKRGRTHITAPVLLPAGPCSLVLPTVHSICPFYLGVLQRANICQHRPTF